MARVSSSLIFQIGVGHPAQDVGKGGDETGPIGFEVVQPLDDLAHRSVSPPAPRGGSSSRRNPRNFRIDIGTLYGKVIEQSIYSSLAAASRKGR